MPTKQLGNYSTIIGKFKFNYLVYIYMSVILFSPSYTYYMAVTHKQEPPFPHATVTNTACHYPQDIQFRWTMGLAEGFLLLIFHIIFKFVDQKAKQYQYQGNTYQYMYWPTMLSILGYMTAIGTIDGGGTGTAHTVGAVYFFILLYFNVVNISVVCYKIYQWDARSFSRSSIYKKSLLSIYLTIVWFYCLFGLIGQLFEGSKNADDKYIVIVEWNLTFAGLLWVLCFHYDWKNCSFCLKRWENMSNMFVQ